MNPPRTHPLSSALILFFFTWIKSWFIIAGRTRKSVVLDCAHEDAQFGSDKYIAEKKAKSVICMPIILNNVLKVSLLTPPHPFPALPLFHTHTYIITGHHVSWKQFVWGNVHAEQSGLADGSYQPGMLSLLYSFPCFSFLLYMYTYLLIRLLLLFQYILNSYDRWRSRLKTSNSSMSRFVSSRKRWGNWTQINHLALLATSNTYKFQQANLPIRFEQLQREEEVQRRKVDSAEKFKAQLENFVDMICHEIRGS